jgi:hypothetical protein
MSWIWTNLRFDFPQQEPWMGSVSRYILSQRFFRTMYLFGMKTIWIIIVLNFTSIGDLTAK